MPAQALPTHVAHARLADGHPWSAVNFDDQDWESAPPASHDAQDNSTAWKVAAGVVVGVVLGGALVYALDRYLPQLALSETAQVFGQAMRDSSRNTAPAPATEPAPVTPRATAQAAAAASLEGALQEAQAEPPSAGASAPPAEPVRVERRADVRHVAPQRDRNESERKARAWALSYKKPQHCIDNPSADTLVECANHYIRAKREFEQACEQASRSGPQ